VHDALVVRLREGVGDLAGDVEYPIDIERSALDQRRNGRALDVLHCDVAHPAPFVLDFAGFVNHRNVGMVERRRRAGLGQQACPLVSGRTLVKRFEGNNALEVQIFGAVDVTHATGPQLVQHAIMRQHLADHGVIMTHRISVEISTRDR
jgi:hypothetical protein